MKTNTEKIFNMLPLVLNQLYGDNLQDFKMPRSNTADIEMICSLLQIKNTKTNRQTIYNIWKKNLGKQFKAPGETRKP